MRPPHIVVIGSLNMDLVVQLDRMPRAGETLQGHDIQYIPGGKGANQAVGCAKLGADVTMIGAIGGDAFGRQIVAELAQYGVSTDKITVIDETPTGTATILHTQEDNCIAIVAGANAYCTAELVEAYADTIAQADMLIVQLEIPVDAVQRALEIARSHRVRTMLNPAPAQQLQSDLLELVDLLTPNETEFEILTGASYDSDENLEEAMRTWNKQYDQTLIVTRGKQGCSYLAVGDERVITVPSETVPVVDTTGAGDAFNAALCYGITTARPLGEAISFAVKAAGLSVTKFGAQKGMPSLSEVIHV
jgi:ribokinase